MTRMDEIQALRNASLELHKLSMETVKEPMPIWRIVHHAEQYVDNLLTEILRAS